MNVSLARIEMVSFTEYNNTDITGNDQLQKKTDKIKKEQRKTM